MPAPRTGVALLSQLHSHQTDAELIGRFMADRDEAAFAAVVRRHGPAVLGVCRRILADPADADDAFQAVFLVLARKAHRVAFRADVSGWLFAVAVRASRELLRRRSRRHGRERTGCPLPDVPSAPSADADAGRAVLDEVARLPDGCRAAVVLCELEGRSRADAARRLGIPEGTLSSRLATARRTLARRLTARGLAPIVVALPAATAGLASASVVPSERVTELAEAVMRTGSWAKSGLLAAVAVLVGIGLAVGGEPAKPTPAAEAKQADGGCLLVQELPTPYYPPPVVPAGGAVQPSPVIPPVMLVPPGNAVRLRRLSPDGTEQESLALRTRDGRPMLGGFTPVGPGFFGGGPFGMASDGRRVAYMTHKPLPLVLSAVPVTDNPVPIADDQFAPQDAVLQPLAGGPTVTLPKDVIVRCWSRDGAAVFGVRTKDIPSWSDAVAYTTVRIDAATGRAESLEMPADANMQDVFPDGRSFLVTLEATHLLADSRRLARVTPGRDGKPAEVVPLTPVTVCSVAAVKVSPDGRRVAYLIGSHGSEWMPIAKDGEVGLFVLDLGTGTTTRLPLDVNRLDFVFGNGLVWSPDGRRLAVSMNRIWTPGNPSGCGGRVLVCDADGRNMTTLRVGTPVGPTEAAKMHPFVRLLAWN